MFATNEEAAKLAYERAKLTQLDSDSTESYSSSDYDIADTALANHCKGVTALGRCGGEVLALARWGGSAMFRAQYISDLREIVEQYELILLYP